jgi:cold shock CspA family protein
LFVHARNVIGRTLEKGDRVEFEVGPSPRDERPEAKQVGVLGC